MIYVTDNFTLDMVIETSYTLVPKTMKKSNFMKKIKKAKSSIGSKIIAQMLHKPRRKEKIVLKKGDELCVVTSEFGRKHSCEYTHTKKFRFEVFSIN